MCQSPPFVPLSIDSNCTDEEIVKCLHKLVKGAPLPGNVIADTNPYQFEPSNLPGRIWYLLHSDENKETKLGSWIERGEAYQVYEDANITGWRTTRDFFKGPPISLKKTDWVMQEYKITPNGQCEKDMPEDFGILCTVFSSDGEGPSSGLHNDCDTTSTNLLHSKLTMPSTKSKCVQNCGSSSKNMELLVAEERQDQVSEAILELDSILRGDYLELDDLVDQESICSSSDNSSCVSITSDECFDSLALLRDLEDEINKELNGKSSKSNFSVAGSAKSDKVIWHPATLGSIATGSLSESSKEEVAHKGKEEVAHKRQKGDLTNEASTSGRDKFVVEEEKDSRSKKKGKNKYLCFLPF